MTRQMILAALASLALAACSKPTELASDSGSPVEPAPPPAASSPPDTSGPATSSIDAEIKERFPDYKPKDTPDTVADYRSSVAGDIGALPSDPAGLAQAFLDWKAKAAANPGATEDGAVQLGADPKEYRPSDAELVAAAAGEKLSAILTTAPVDARAAAEAVLAAPDARAYKRFDFRHVDVMGSGRFFYSSPPKDARIPG